MTPLGIQILEALAPYLVPVIIAVLGVLVKNAIDHLPVNVQPKVYDAVHSAVAAVEQVANQQLSGPGKKQLAIEYVQKQLDAMHINVPEPVLSTLIEEAVYGLHQSQASQPQAVPVSAAPVAQAVTEAHTG
jgi:Bacteriophage holin of superfamily 6 (Holin_LLH)